MPVALVKCPDCFHTTTLEISFPSAVMLNFEEDGPAPFVSKDVVCKNCNKEMHVCLEMDVFED